MVLYLKQIHFFICAKIHFILQTTSTILTKKDFPKALSMGNTFSICVNLSVYKPRFLTFIC